MVIIRACLHRYVRIGTCASFRVHRYVRIVSCASVRAYVPASIVSASVRAHTRNDPTCIKNQRQRWRESETCLEKHRKMLRKEMEGACKAGPEQQPLTSISSISVEISKPLTSISSRPIPDSRGGAIQGGSRGGRRGGQVLNRGAARWSDRREQMIAASAPENSLKGVQIVAAPQRMPHDPHSFPTASSRWLLGCLSRGI